MKGTLKVEQRLAQKKHWLAMEEISIKVKARKLHTKKLIDTGQLIAKAGIDFLSRESFLGALLFLKEQLDFATNNAQDENILANWTKKGDNALIAENKDKNLVILKLNYSEYLLTKMILQKYQLKWDDFRKQWYGYIGNAALLKEELRYIVVDIDNKFFCYLVT